MMFNFSFEITSPNVDDETASNRLYEAGCDDALFSVSNGIYEIEFDREAASLQEAILSAIHNVKMSQIGSIILNVFTN